MPRSKAALVMLSLATAFVPATLVAQTTNGAVPGSLNYVQGQANIDGQQINTQNSSPTQPRQLHAGERLATANGSADILMAPGALLRIGQDTTVQMVNTGADRTEIRLESGRANVSVNVVRKQHLLLVDMPNGQTQLLSRGLYTFNTATNTMRVFNGEAYAFPGTDTASNVKPEKVKEGHEIILGGDRAKAEKFDREDLAEADSDLLPWTGPREAQAVVGSHGAMYNGDVSYSSAGYYPGAYGFGGGYGGYGFGGYGAYGFGDPFYAGYPYGGYGGWGPYGFYGYPFFGVGFGYWGGGFYRGGGSYGGSTLNHGGYPIHGGNVGRGVAAGRGFSGGRAFSSGAIHGGGFGGGGFHGGGGGGHR